MTNELLEKLKDPLWRLEHLYHIKSEEAQKVLFFPNPMQRILLQQLHWRVLIAKARQLGMCLDPNTKVLTADLRWVLLKDVQVGQELVSVDENVPGGRGVGRKMRRTIVEGKRSVFEPAFKLKMDNGEELIATAQHRFLMLRHGGTEMVWRKVSDSRVGDEIRLVTKPWSGMEYEDGWFGGMLDGEGSLSLRSRAGASLSVSQIAGPIWERLVKYVSERGFNFRMEWDRRKGGDTSKLGNKPVGKVVFTRMGEIFRVIGQTRPTRFLNRNWWEGKALPQGRNGDMRAKIVSIEALPAQEMIDLQTSTKTFIAEGFVSHNSTFIEIFLLDFLLFHKNKQAAIVADKKENATKLFEKVEFAWTNLRQDVKDYLGLTCISDSASKMEFSNGSSVVTGTTIHAGTYQFLHISELGPLAAESPDKASVVMKSALPTVHNKPNTYIFIESTSEGEGNEFHERALDAQAVTERAASICPENPSKALLTMQFRFIFFAWWQDPKYALSDDEAEQVQVPKPIRDYFKEMEKRLKVTFSINQVAWYTLQAKALKGRMKEQYPSYAEESFLSSGNKLFDADIIKAKLAKEAREAIEVDGNWKIYLPYRRGHRYGMGADVSMGVGEHHSTAAVIDFDTMEVVATFMDNRIAPIPFAYELARFGNRYGTCLIAPEANSIGHTTVHKLAEIYPNVYRYHIQGLVEDKETERLGWLTNSGTKGKMLYALKDIMEEAEKPLIVPDAVILREALSYKKESVTETETITRLKGMTSHSDLLIATAIAWQMMPYAQFSADADDPDAARTVHTRRERERSSR